MTPYPRYRCRFCGLELPAWLPVAKAPNGAMLLMHLSPRHRAEMPVKRLLERIRTEDIAETAAEAFEVVEEET